jgi:hypothetical protein
MYMISTKFHFLKMIAAIQTNILVTSKQCPVGEGRLLFVLCIHFTFASDDAAQLHDRSLPVKPGITAMYFHNFLTISPAHEFSGMKANRLLPTQPFNGKSCRIEPQYSQFHFFTSKKSPGGYSARGFSSSTMIRIRLATGLLR